jgi:hypothetical protein
MKKLAAELITIILGVLIALGVDDWRQAREEERVANEHLVDLTAEVRQNLCTVERIRVRHMPRKLESLQTVLTFLNDPPAKVDDPKALLQAFAHSTAASLPWLVDNQYQALQNSGDVRLVRKLQPTLALSAIYRAPEVLLSQAERIQGQYPIVVNELLPAQLQAEFSQLRGYVRDGQENEAPPLVDDADLSKAIDAIRARRVELLALARNEAAVSTGRWFALTRLSTDMKELVREMAPWDRSTVSLEQDLKDCTGSRLFRTKDPNVR